MAASKSIPTASVNANHSHCKETSLIIVSGRTGRIGHRGVATSFYTDRDEPIADVLVRTLLETGQDVPPFLESYVPQGDAREHLKFETESDYDPNDFGGAAGEDSGTAWGASGGDDTSGAGGGDSGGAWGATDAAATTTDTGGGWGSAAPAPANDGWN